MWEDFSIEKWNGRNYDSKKEKEGEEKERKMEQFMFLVSSCLDWHELSEMWTVTFFSLGSLSLSISFNLPSPSSSSPLFLSLLVSSSCSSSCLKILCTLSLLSQLHFRSFVVFFSLLVFFERETLKRKEGSTLFVLLFLVSFFLEFFVPSSSFLSQIDFWYCSPKTRSFSTSSFLSFLSLLLPFSPSFLFQKVIMMWIIHPEEDEFLPLSSFFLLLLSHQFSSLSSSSSFRGRVSCNISESILLRFHDWCTLRGWKKEAPASRTSQAVFTVQLTVENRREREKKEFWTIKIPSSGSFCATRHFSLPKIFLPLKNCSLQKCSVNQLLLREMSLDVRKKTDSNRERGREILREKESYEGRKKITSYIYYEAVIQDMMIRVWWLMKFQMMLMLLTIRNVRVRVRKNDTERENGRKKEEKRGGKVGEWKEGENEKKWIHTLQNSIPVINGFSEMYSMEYVS